MEIKRIQIFISFSFHRLIPSIPYVYLLEHRLVYMIQDIKT